LFPDTSRGSKKWNRITRARVEQQEETLKVFLLVEVLTGESLNPTIIIFRFYVANEPHHCAAPRELLLLALDPFDGANVPDGIPAICLPICFYFSITDWEPRRTKSGKSHNTGYKTRARVNRLGQTATITDKKMDKKLKRVLGVS